MDQLTEERVGHEQAVDARGGPVDRYRGRDITLMRRSVDQLTELDVGLSQDQVLDQLISRSTRPVDQVVWDMVKINTRPVDQSSVRLG